MRRTSATGSGKFAYHIDFVLCEPTTTRPLLAIELDDRSHRSARSIERDRFKDEVLATGGVPVYRVPASQAYDPLELAAEIARLMSSVDGGARPVV